MRAHKSLIAGAFCLIGFFLYSQDLSVVTEEWAPYNYTENGTIKGVSTEIVVKVLDKAGVKYKIDVYPWSRTYFLAQTNPNTLIYTIIRTPERESMFKWVGALGKGGTTSLYRLKSNSRVTAKTVDEAKKLSVITNKDSMDELWMTKKGFAKLEITPSVETSVKMFMLGRVDLIAFDNSVMAETLKKEGYKAEDLVKVVDLFATPPYMALSPQTDDGVLLKIQKAYDELLKSGVIKMVN
jgi:polar amino acid transport system substrate-binding protein